MKIGGIALALKITALVISFLALSRIVETHADSRALEKFALSSDVILIKHIPEDLSESLPIIGLTENNINSRSLLSREIGALTQAQYLLIGLVVNIVTGKQIGRAHV